MKRKIILAIILIFVSPNIIYASAGTMSFFGGISEGLRMPTITNRLLNPALNGRRNIAGTYAYSEMVFLSGNPSEFIGQLTVAQSGGITDTTNMGTFVLTNIIAPNANTVEGTSIERNIAFSVSWRRENNQIIKNYSVNNWAETITVSGSTFTLQPAQSYFIISIIEDHNPGIVFYRGNISKRAVYTTGTGDEATLVTVEATGHIYGFDSPFSSTETQSLDVWVMADNWQMSYQVRPTVSVTTSLLYQQTTPTAISFAGNYSHIMTNNSMASYDIFVVPGPYHYIPTSGSINIATHNTFEQLPASDMSTLQGHFAQQDISRLFAQQILTGPVTHFRPNQAMTRGEFIVALVRALRIELGEVRPNNVFNRTTRIVFPDVESSRPEYVYILGAYRAGLAYGRADGNFHLDSPITREEVIATLIRALGLSSVVPNPMPVTAFNDSMQISTWATREISAALELGLIAGDSNGNLRPRDIITKAEASALINRFIDYMREDLVFDYSERMINFVW
ncbi:MAG: S-layer homology domain-containing protein [Defluviitaleaceae bacterium]|nr:S-layer homology domain-containing protein [Defluviitaleaceae bacterium]